MSSTSSDDDDDVREAEAEVMVGWAEYGGSRRYGVHQIAQRTFSPPLLLYPGL